MECRICKSPVILADDRYANPYIAQVQFFEGLCDKHAFLVIDAKVLSTETKLVLSHSGIEWLNDIDNPE